MADLLSLELRAITLAARGIWLFEFRAAPGQGDLPRFEAGAHLSLLLPSGLERQYSLCNDPAEAGRYVVAVKREEAGRGGSREMHEALRPGQVVRARPPANHFPLSDQAGEILLIAGGIGITPILAMAWTLSREGRPFRLVYLARSRAEAAFLEELPDLVPPGRLTLHFDDEAASLCDIPALVGGAVDGVCLHCCGPKPMMDAVRTAAADWPEDRRRFEYFSNDQPASVEGDQPFRLVLARQGREIDVGADETPLEALLREGVDVDYSCTEGTCGTCITRVISGDVDHRDAVLMPGERADHVVLCCSRAKGALLTIDL